MFGRVVALAVGPALGVVALGAAGCAANGGAVGAPPQGVARGEGTTAGPAAAGAHRASAGAHLSSAGAVADVRGHWVRQQAPANLGRLNLMSVSCTEGGRHCVAVGVACPLHGCAVPEPSVIISTANGGESWMRRPVPAGVGDLVAVSCVTARRCVAAGDRTSLGRSTRGSGPSVSGPSVSGSSGSGPSVLGPSGSEVSPGDGAPDGAVSPRASTEGAFLITTSGGARWRVVADARVFSPEGISCPTAATCFAVGHSPRKPAAIAVTRNGGTSWASQALPGALGALSAISCWSAARCVALGFSATGRALALTTTDGGRAWARHAMPDSGLTSISCPDARTCFAVGVNASGTAGMIAKSNNGGVAWVTRAAPPGIAFSGVSCPSATACAAVGSHPASQLRAVAATTSGGTAWVNVAIPAGLGNLFGVSCVPGGSCTAVGAWRRHGNMAEGPYIVSNQSGLRSLRRRHSFAASANAVSSDWAISHHDHGSILCDNTEGGGSCRTSSDSTSHG